MTSEQTPSEIKAASADGSPTHGNDTNDSNLSINESAYIMMAKLEKEAMLLYERVPNGEKDQENGKSDDNYTRVLHMFNVFVPQLMDAPFNADLQTAQMTILRGMDLAYLKVVNELEEQRSEKLGLVLRRLSESVEKKIEDNARMASLQQDLQRLQQDVQQLLLCPPFNVSMGAFIFQQMCGSNL